MNASLLMLLLAMPPAQAPATADAAASSSASTSASSTADLLEGPKVEWLETRGGNSHFYEVVGAPSGINWTDAQVWATSHGGYLATIVTTAEDKFVYTLLGDARYQDASVYHSFWIGGIQPPGSHEPGGDWKWVNNEGAVSDDEWGPGQPDNLDGNENRMAMFGPNVKEPPGSWDDRAMTDLVHGFVVEFDPPVSHASMQVASHQGIYIAGFVVAMVLLLFFNCRKPLPPQRTPE